MQHLYSMLDFRHYSENGISLYDAFLRMGWAMILGLIIGLERERRDRGAGMRTHGVVAMASSLIMIVSIHGMPLMADGTRGDPGRIAAQVVSGIGFLGAGVIFMRRDVIHGLTTAATVWGVAGIGLAVGGGMMWVGAIGAALMLLIAGGMRPVDRELKSRQSREHKIKIFLSDPDQFPDLLAELAMGKPGFEVMSAALDPEKKVADVVIRIRRTGEFGHIYRQVRSLPGVTNVGWRYKLDD